MMKHLKSILLTLCLIALIGGITSPQFSLPLLSNLTEAFGNVSLFTDKPVYYLNDTVNITVKVSSNTTTNLTIEDPLQGIQSTWDLGSFTHPYNPGYTGNYTVYAFHSLGNLTGNSSVCFTVLQSPVENKTNETLSNETQIPENVTDSQLNSAYLSTDKLSYFLNETVRIYVKAPVNTTTNLSIHDPLGGIYSTLKENLGNFTHIHPLEHTGNYSVYALFSLGNLTGNATTFFTVLRLPVENITNETPIHENVSNETQTLENLNISPLDSASLSTEKPSYLLNETVRISLKAPENTTANLTIQNPLGGFYSTLKENFGGFTHLYLPEFLGDYLILARLSLENYTRELNTSFEVAPVNVTESPENLTSLIQGDAEIGKPVEWIKKIRVRNNDSLLRLNLTVSLPCDALNVTVDGRKSEPRLLHAMGKKPKKIHIWELLEPNETREFLVVYGTSAPYKTEQILESEAKYLKKIRIKSDSSAHYRNVKAYTDVEELSLYNPRLYHLVNGSRLDVTQNPLYNVSFLDVDSNGIVDRLEWTVPQLSNQTFEVEADLTVLNVQSYPTLEGNWTVQFTTQGKADLTVTVVDGTEFGVDLEFLEMRCGIETLSYERINDSLFIPDFSCNETGYEISKVLTTGKHTLEFRFGSDVEYAFNLVAENLSFVSPTPENNSYRSKDWVYVNISSDESLNQSLLEWGNSTGYYNVSMDNSSATNWYVNMTSLSDYAFNYTVWAQNTTSVWVQTGRRFITVDTTAPAIAFIPPTPPDNNVTSNNYVYVNVSVNDSSPTSSFIDWNYSLVGFWNFEYVLSNGTVYDNSSYGNNGLMYNFSSNTTTTGRYGQGLEFDGVDDCVNVSSFNPHSYGSFTISAWYKSANTSVIDDQYIWRHTSQSNDKIIFATTDDTGYKDMVRLLIDNGGAGGAKYFGTSDVVDQQWHHLVAVRDSSKVRIYVDGVLENETDDTYAGQTVVVDGDGPYIGDNPGDTEQVNGTLDEVQVWDRALSAEEINASYNSYVWRLERNFTGLSEGTYDYYAYSIDLAGNENKTETRNVTVDAVSPFYTSKCINLTEANSTYYLIGSVNSSGTCFTILANNITLDCKGYTINYSQSSLGYAVNNTGYNLTTIRDCNIVQGGNSASAYAVYVQNAYYANITNNTIETNNDSSTDYKHGIYFKTTSNSTITNNTIDIYRDYYNYGIYIYSSSNNNNISNNEITTSGTGWCYGINLGSSSTLNTVSGNNITASGSNNHGVGLGASYNTISNNIITTEGSAICAGSHNNNISNNEITTSGQFGYGIELQYSNRTTISNNTISTSNIYSYGIYIWRSSYSNISCNSINNTRGYAIYISPTTTDSEYNHTIDTTNTKFGEPIYYYFGNDSITIENLDNIGQLYVAVLDNVTVRNLTMDKDGITLAKTTNSSVKDCNITPSGSNVDGILLSYSNSTTVSNNTISISKYSSNGIRLAYSDDNTLSNNTILHNRSGEGIFLLSSSSNSISDSIISTSWGASSNGIQLSSSNNNNITSCTINASYPNVGDLYLLNSNNTKVIDSDYTDIYYNDNTSDLWRYWYLDVYVNDSIGNPVNQANVSSWNVYEEQQFTELTASSGYVTRQTLLEYNQSNVTPGYYSSAKFGYETFYTNHTVNATKYGYNESSRQVNLTENMEIYLQIYNPPPSVIINYPLNDSYTNDNTPSLNASASDTDPDSMLYSLDSGVNSSAGCSSISCIVGNMRNNSWFYSDWVYRKNITILNTAGNLSNHQVLIDLNPSNFNFSKANSDGNDTRFTFYNKTSGLELEIYFWIESWNSTTNTSRLWVKTPFLENNTNTTVYMYYGNPSASRASNGTVTFEFFEDFLGASLDASKWTVGGSGTVEVSDSKVTVKSNATNGKKIINSTSTFGVGYALRAYAKMYTGGGNNVAYIAFLAYDGQEYAYIREKDNYCGTKWCFYTATEGNYTNMYSDEERDHNYHTYKILRVNSSSVKFQVDSGTLKTATENISLYNLPIELLARHTNDYIEADWILIHKYTNPEPTASIGSEDSSDNYPLSDGIHNITVYANDSAGNLNSSTVYFTIDTINPALEFIQPTPDNDSYRSKNWTYINVSVSDSSDTSSFIDWNRSLVGYWAMDWYNSTGVYDNSTYGNFGEFKGGLGANNITDGRYGKALEFDGNNDYITCGNDSSLKITGAITLEGWVKFNSLSDSYQLFGRGMGLTGNGNYGYAVSYLSDYDIVFDTHNTTTRDVTTAYNVITDAEKWYHIAATWDGTTNSNAKKIYLNGGIVRQESSMISEMGVPDYNFEIGRKPINVLFLDGSIDEVRVWNRALSPEEINASYNSGLWRLEQNYTNLSDGTYEYYAYSIDRAGNTNKTETRTVGIDTINPAVEFIPPTPGNDSYRNKNWTYINVSINDDLDTSSFIDWNRSLVGWWSFNETGGTTVYDLSTYSNDGNMTNMNTGVDNCTGNCSGRTASGKFGYGMMFDGVDDYVDCGNDSIMDSFNSTQEIAMEIWVFLPTLDQKSWPSLIRKEESMAPRTSVFNLYFENSSKKIAYEFYTNGSVNAVKTGVLSSDTWYHIVATRFSYGNDNMRIYVNGLLNNTVTSSKTIPSQLNAKVTMGSGTGYFNGTIDEVRIWNRALSAEEINASYNSGLYRLYHNFTNLSDGSYEYYAYSIDQAGNVNKTETRSLGIDTTAPAVDFTSPTPPDNDSFRNKDWAYINVSVNDSSDTSSFIDWNRSLVGYWSFESVNASNYTLDFTDYGNHGLLKDVNISNSDGNTLPQLTSGKYGNALYFDGMDDYIDCGNDSSLDVTDEITIEAWVKIAGHNENSNWQTIVHKGAEWNTGYWFLVDDIRRVAVNLENIVTYTDTYTTSIEYDKWYHLAITYTNGSLRIYLNGSVAKSRADTGSIGTTNRNLQIGRVERGGSQYRFNGTIDEVRVWNRTLTPEEINASYNSGLWRLEQNFTNLSDGTYEYYAYSIDRAGNVNKTGTYVTTVIHNLNITLLNSTGDVVSGAQVLAYEMGTMNLACNETSDIQGKIICGVNPVKEYYVKTSYGVNMYNITVPNQLKIQEYTTTKNLQNLTVVYMNDTGQPVPDMNITVYETGGNVIACQGLSNNNGVIKCELDNTTNYDIQIEEYAKSPINLTIPDAVTLQTVEIKLINTSGGGVSGKEISLYDSGLRCQGNTSAEGTVNCVLDPGNEYKVETDYGANIYEIKIPNNVTLRYYTGTVSLGNITVTLNNESGGFYNGGTVSVYDSQGLACQGYSSTAGRLVCEINQTMEYDIKTVKGVNMYNAPTVNNVILMYYTGTELENLTVNLIDGSGNPIANETVTVKNATDKAVVCHGNTNSQGQLICEVNVAFRYDINTSYGVNMYNIEVPNNVTILDYTTEKTLGNLSITLKNYAGSLMKNKTLWVYEAGTSILVCGGNTSTEGEITCGLDTFKNYDIKFNETCVYASTLIPRNLLVVEAGECSTLPCTVTVPELGEDQYAIKIPETSIKVLKCLNTECSKTAEAVYHMRDSDDDGLNETVILEASEGKYLITTTELGALVITKPKKNTYQKGNTTITAIAPDDTTKIKFRIINGSNTFAVNGSMGETNDTEIPYKQTWETGNFADGIYNITAQAYDSSGILLAEDTIENITVDNTAPNVYDPKPDADQNSRKFTTSINTSEDSTCRYAFYDVDFESMGGGLSKITGNFHRAKITVDKGGGYTIYFACIDKAGNEGKNNTAEFQVVEEQVVGPTISVSGLEEDYKQGSNVTAFVSMLDSNNQPIDASTYCNITIRHWNATAMKYDLQDVAMTKIRTGWYYYNYHIDENADTGTYGVLVEADPEGIDTHDSAGFHVAEWIKTIEQINETVEKIWATLKRTNQSVLKNETVSSFILNSSSSIKIEYNITIPLKEGYTIEDYLPVRWKYWFIDSDGNCIDQNLQSRGVTPQCNPLTVQALGKGNSSLVVNVTLRPALDVGDYTLVRELEIDPNQIWISYGQEPIGRIQVLESVYTAKASVEKTGYEKQTVTEAVETTTTTLRKPEITGKAIAIEKEDRTPWTLIISLTMIISLIAYAIIRIRQKPDEEEERKWYGR